MNAFKGFLTILIGGLAIFISARNCHAQTDFPAGKLSREQLPKTRALDYEFDAVRISTILGWLRRVSVEPPVPLRGTVSGWLWAQAPSSGWWRLGDYRVEGELSSPLLGVDRFAIRDARVRFGYQQSLWTIGTAEGQIEAESNQGDNRALGLAKLSATLPASVRSNAHVEGQLSSVSLAELLKTFGLNESLPEGQAQATFIVDTQLANLSSPLAWTASGRIAANRLQFGNLSYASVDSRWSLRNEVLGLTNTQISLPGPNKQSLALAGQVKLRDAFQWQVELPRQLVQLTPSLFASFLPSGAALSNLPSGSLNISGATSGTLSPWSASYQLQLNDGQLNWLGNLLSNVTARLSLNNAGLAIETLAFRTAGGALSGASTFTANLDEPLSANISYEQMDLSTLRAPVELPKMVGRVSGQARLSIDKRSMSDWKSLAAEVTGAGQGVRIGDWGLGNVQYTLNKLANRAEIEVNLQDAGRARRWMADGQFSSRDGGDWRYKIDARSNALDLAVPQLIRLIGTDTQLPVPLEILLVTGNVTLEGDRTGGLNSTEFNFSNITTLERDRRIWSQGSMKGKSTRQFVEIERSQWKVGGSDIEAALKWHYLVQDEPTVNEAAARDYLRLNIHGLKLATLEAWRVVSLPTSSDGRRPLDGLLSGQVQLERQAGEESWLTNWQGKVDLRLNELTIHGNDAGDVALAGTLSPDRWQGQVEGELLSAPFEGNVTLSLQQTPTLSVSGANGQVSWLGAEVSQLIGLWQDRQQAANWRGTSNVRGDLRWNIHEQPSGTFEVEVAQLSYRQRTIVRNLQAVAELDNQRLRIVRFDGGLGGGRVDVNGQLDLKTRLLEGVVVQLQRVSLEQVAQLIDPQWDQQLSGRADLRARVRIDNGLDMHGDLRLHDANWVGIPINEMHAGFEMTGSQDWSVLRLRTSTARGRIMGGRADADLQARFGTKNSIDLRLRVDRGEVEQLSEWTGTSSVVGKGKFDARLNLASANASSVRDLRGVLDLTFEDTDARTLPVADQLSRFVPLFGLPSTEFERGKLSATISQGALRMRSLALWGRQLSVLGSGNVGISSGRLDLQLVIRTGGGLSQQVAANFLTQLAATTVPQVELVLQINRLIANRAIFLRIAGTASKPVIQPQAARMLEQALLRSLLEQAVVVAP